MKKSNLVEIADLNNIRIVRNGINVILALVVAFLTIDLFLSENINCNLFLLSFAGVALLLNNKKN
jgi:hypothetical protein